MMFCDTDKALTICICSAVVVKKNEGNSEIPWKTKAARNEKKENKCTGFPLCRSAISVPKRGLPTNNELEVIIIKFGLIFSVINS